MKIGDLVKNKAVPVDTAGGGLCIILGIEHVSTRGVGYPWSDHDYPILTVLHPTAGVIEDASFYYEAISECHQLPSPRYRWRWHRIPKLEEPDDSGSDH